MAISLHHLQHFTMLERHLLRTFFANSGFQRWHELEMHLLLVLYISLSDQALQSLMRSKWGSHRPYTYCTCGNLIHSITLHLSIKCLAALLAFCLQHVRPAHPDCLSWDRNCVGQALAMMEARAAVAMLAASFEFAPDASMKGKREQWLSNEQVFRVGSHC